MPQTDRPAHQERMKKVDCFLRTGRIFIWNNSFRAQIRLRMHLRASRTLWLLAAAQGAPDSRPQWHCTTSAQPCTPKMVNCFLKTTNFDLESLIWASGKADNALRASGFWGLHWQRRTAPCAQMAYGLGHPRSLKVMKKIEPTKSAKKELSPEILKKKIEPWISTKKIVS